MHAMRIRRDENRGSASTRMMRVCHTACLALGVHGDGQRQLWLRLAGVAETLRGSPSARVRWSEGRIAEVCNINVLLHRVL